MDIFKKLFTGVKSKTKEDAFNKLYATPYTAENASCDPNIILAKGLELSLTGESIKTANKKNANVAVIGGAGTGKSWAYVRPNILQCNSSFVCLDPLGENMHATADVLREKGYTIKAFSVTDMPSFYTNGSNLFNPLDYIYDKNGNLSRHKVRSVAQILVREIGDQKQGDPFWNKMACSILMACIEYLAEFCRPEDRKLHNVFRIIHDGLKPHADTGDESKAEDSRLDQLFKELKQKNKDALCLIDYDDFKQAPERTAYSILLQLSTNFNVFQINENLRRVTKTDYLSERDETGNQMRSDKNIDLLALGKTKTAIFLLIPVTTSEYNWLYKTLIDIAFTELYSYAEENGQIPLQVPVRFYLDEFGAIGQMYDLDKVLATCRKYNISVSIIVQAIDQIKTLYKERYESLLGNCDTVLYLGGGGFNTQEFITKKCGGKISVNDLTVLNNEMCVVFVRGVEPIIAHKYNLTEHPNYKIE